MLSRNLAGENLTAAAKASCVHVAIAHGSCAALAREGTHGSHGRMWRRHVAAAPKLTTDDVETPNPHPKPEMTY